MKKLKKSLLRTAKRLATRWRALQLVRWLSDQEDVLWISVLEPSAAARQAGIPEPNAYRGLCAITEVRNSATGRFEWHFLWGSQARADEHEPAISESFSSPAMRSVRTAVCRTAMRKRGLWTRSTLFWGFLTAAVASIATVLSNLNDINDYWLERQHEPEMTLESHDSIVVASDDSKPIGRVTLRGDPFFRTRLTNLSMQLVPDAKFPGTPALPKEGVIVVPSLRRSIDVSEEMTVSLPLGNVPAGRYLLTLRGTVESNRNKAEFAPQEKIRVDIRNPIALRKLAVKPRFPMDAAAAPFTDALVEFRIVFGSTARALPGVTIVLRGQWVNWFIDDHPSAATPIEISKISAQAPKSIVFELRDLPVERFGSHYVRLAVRSPVPWTLEQWERETSDFYADFVN